jgi:adenylate cyclase
VASRKDPATQLLRRFVRRREHTPALAQFHDALTREILLTERMRIKGVIITASLLAAAFTLLHLVAP